VKALGNYKLDENGNAVRCEDFMEWAAWFETFDRHVARDEVRRWLVSTIFLGVDHRRDPNVGLPVLWETMVWDAEHEVQLCRRYTSQADAFVGHQEVVDVLRTWDKDLRELEHIAGLEAPQKELKHD